MEHQQISEKLGEFSEAQPLIQQKRFIGITRQQQPNLTSSSSSASSTSSSQLFSPSLVPPSQNRQHVNHNNNLSSSSNGGNNNNNNAISNSSGNNNSGSGISKSHSNLYLNNSSNNSSNNLNNNNLISSSVSNCMSNANNSRQSILPQTLQNQPQQPTNQQQLYQYPSRSYTKHTDNKPAYNGRGGYPGQPVSKNDIHSKSGVAPAKLPPPPVPHIQSPTPLAATGATAGPGTMLPPSTTMMPNGRPNDNFLAPPLNGARFSQPIKRKSEVCVSLFYFKLSLKTFHPTERSRL